MNNIRYVILMAVAATTIASCKSDEVKALLRKEFKTEAVSVKAIQVKYTDNVTATRLVGRVEPGKSAVVSSQWSGTVDKVCVKKGQKVAKGSVLAQIDAQGVKSAYEAAKASFEQAEDALQRVEKVYGNGSVSQIKLLDIKTQYAKAKATLESAEKAMEDCCVKAPFSGVIGEIFVEQGVQLSSLTPMFELLDHSSVEIHASIPENEYSLYSVGTDAEIEIPAIDRTVNATLAVKGVQASSLSHSYDLCFKINGSSTGIMPGMTCKVRILSSGAQIVIIPASAVKTDLQGRYVWCCNDGTVEKRHIVTGGFVADGIVVESGLQQDDLVIVEGARKVSSGMKDIKVIVL